MLPKVSERICAPTSSRPSINSLSPWPWWKASQECGTSETRPPRDSRPDARSRHLYGAAASPDQGRPRREQDTSKNQRRDHWKAAEWQLRGRVLGRPGEPEPGTLDRGGRGDLAVNVEIDGPWLCRLVDPSQNLGLAVVAEVVEHPIPHRGVRALVCLAPRAVCQHETPREAPVHARFRRPPPQRSVERDHDRPTLPGAVQAHERTARLRAGIGPTRVNDKMTEGAPVDRAERDNLRTRDARTA